MLSLCNILIYYNAFFKCIFNLKYNFFIYYLNLNINLSDINSNSIKSLMHSEVEKVIERYLNG